MIGGYLSFAGIQGKARYHDTPVETALPVTISSHDDRAERPEGVHPAVAQPGHAVLDGVPEDWPALLCHNRLTGKSATQVLVLCDADPLPVVGSHGAAFASDCPPTGAHSTSWLGPATTPGGPTWSASWPGGRNRPRPRRCPAPCPLPYKVKILDRTDRRPRPRPPAR